MCNDTNIWCWSENKWVENTCRNYLAVSQFIYHPAPRILVLGIYPREMSKRSDKRHKNIYYIIYNSSTLERFKYSPPTSGWTYKLWYIYLKIYNISQREGSTVQCTKVDENSGLKFWAIDSRHRSIYCILF